MSTVITLVTCMNSYTLHTKKEVDINFTSSCFHTEALLVSTHIHLIGKWWLSQQPLLKLYLSTLVCSRTSLCTLSLHHSPYQPRKNPALLPDSGAECQWGGI